MKRTFDRAKKFEQENPSKFTLIFSAVFNAARAVFARFSFIRQSLQISMVM